MEQRELATGGFYRHFKNKLYQVKCVAYHSETKEKMVVYQALYGDYSVYVRPYDMFMSEVDHDKYPDIYQKYRFEQVFPDGSSMPHITANKNQTNMIFQNNSDESAKKEIIEREENVVLNQQDVVKANVISENKTVEIDSNENECDEGEVDERLIRFLDAETYQEKLNILTGLRSKLDDKLIDSMAASLEVEVPEGPIDKRYASLRSCIMTHTKYECSRLRN